MWCVHYFKIWHSQVRSWTTVPCRLMGLVTCPKMVIIFQQWTSGCTDGLHWYICQWIKWSKQQQVLLLIGVWETLNAATSLQKWCSNGRVYAQWFWNSLYVPDAILTNRNRTWWIWSISYTNVCYYNATCSWTQVVVRCWQMFAMLGHFLKSCSNYRNEKFLIITKEISEYVKKAIWEHK